VYYGSVSIKRISYQSCRIGMIDASFQVLFLMIIVQRLYSMIDSQRYEFEVPYIIVQRLSINLQCHILYVSLN